MKLFLFIILLIFSLNCSGDRVKPSVDNSLSVVELPTQESWNSTVTFSDSGRIKAVLWSGHLRMFNDSRETFLDENIKIDFYDTDEIKTTTLTAKKGRVDERTNNLYAQDSVVAVSDSVTITTDEMMWRNSDRKIISDKFVRITTPKEKIEGYGFESDQGLKNYVIYKITYISRNDSI